MSILYRSIKIIDLQQYTIGCKSFIMIRGVLCFAVVI